MYYTPPKIFVQLTYNYLLACIYKNSGNSMDQDQLASEKPADLDLLCFKNCIYLDLAW